MFGGAYFRNFTVFEKVTAKIDLSRKAAFALKNSPR